MSSLDQIEEGIKEELNRVLKQPPIKHVMFYDLDSARFNTPSVFVELEGAKMNDLQVIQPDRTGLDIEYTISVFSAGVDGSQSVRNGQKMVNEVRRRLEREKDPNRLLNQNALSLECLDTVYGTFSIDRFGTRLNYHGGVIKLFVRVIETNVTD